MPKKYAITVGIFALFIIGVLTATADNQDDQIQIQSASQPEQSNIPSMQNSPFAGQVEQMRKMQSSMNENMKSMFDDPFFKQPAFNGQNSNVSRIAHSNYPQIKYFMTAIKTFYDLLVWQKSHKLTLIIYKISNDYPKYELFALTSQTRRSSSSVPTNIVEGFRRQSLKDSIKFYNTADASLEELKYHLLLAKDLNYISNERYNFVLEKTEEVGKLLTRWIQSQRKFLT